MSGHLLAQVQVQGLCQAHLRDHPLEADRQLQSIEDPFFEAERHVLLRLQRDLLGGGDAQDNLKDYMPHILQVRIISIRPHLHKQQAPPTDLKCHETLQIGRPCLVHSLIQLADVSRSFR